MNKRMRELLEKINNKKAEARQLANAGDVEKAKALIEEMKDLQSQFDVEAALYEEEKTKVTPPAPNAQQIKEPVNGVKVFFKALRREQLTDVENALVTGGANGENLIIPEDVQTQINELRREYKSARAIVGYYGTSTLTGSMNYEDISTITELTNFEDGADVPASNEPKFANVTYAVKPYGGLLPVSNRLIANENGGLIPYLGRWFTKKAIKTENKLIFAQLKAGKTAKQLADWKALRTSLNKDIDEMLKGLTIIVTNQDGFDYLDSLEDANSRPLLQTDPTMPTRKMFKGYPIEVFSNADLPTTGTTTKKAPFFYGATTEGATLVEHEVGLQFAISSEAGFSKNQTLIRVIEDIDVVDADKGAYMYGELTLPAEAGA